jgi:hypothetical protein
MKETPCIGVLGISVRGNGAFLSNSPLGCLLARVVQAERFVHQSVPCRPDWLCQQEHVSHPNRVSLDVDGTFHITGGAGIEIWKRDGTKIGSWGETDEAPIHIKLSLSSWTCGL